MVATRVSVAGVLATAISCGSSVLGQSHSDRPITAFVGTWRLVSIVEAGKPVPSRGLQPTGLMFLDPNGYLSVQIMPDRKRPSWAEGRTPSDEQAQAALAGFTSFFGTFSIDPEKRTITYHRQGDIQPGNVGVDLVRRYEFVGEDRLVLTPADYPDRRITWARAR